jgi:hypothetical protein
MTLADYTFYVEEYQGSIIPAENFAKYAEEADLVLKRMTQNRTVDYERQYNLAVCAIADYYYSKNLNNNQTITNETVGSYSVTYANNSSFEYDLAMKYLGNTGILAVGVICN